MKIKLLFLVFTFAFLGNKVIAQNVGIGTSNPVNKLDVMGNAYIGGSLGLGIPNPNLNPAYKLDVLGNVNITGNLFAFGLGATSISGGSISVNTATVNSTATFSGATTINNTLFVSGVTNLNSNASISGNASVNGNLVLGPVSSSGRLSVGGNGYFAGNVGIGVVPSLIYSLQVSGATSISGNTIVQGNLGLGVTNPSSKLDVLGNSHIEGSLFLVGQASIGSTYGGLGAPPSGLLVEGNTGMGVTAPVNKLDVEGAVVIGSSYAGSNTAPANGLLVQGFVGIGNSSPTVPLEVTSANVNVSNYGFLGSSGSTGFFSGTANVPVAIRAAGRIVGVEFNAVSDERIKRNIQTSSSQNDLAILLKLRVTDYQLKDSLYNGNTKVKGLIAQELEHVMPQAVHTNADFVPDIYCMSASTEYNEKNKTLKISLCKPYQLKVGDKVKIFAGDGMQEQYVSAIDNETSFTVNNWEIKQAGMNPVQKVFVWGKWVTDFHTVDYNQVFSLGVSAMQQLARENEELKDKTDSLQQQIDELKKMVMNKDH